MKKLIGKERGQYLAFLGITLMTAACAGILIFHDASFFRKFIGNKNPIVIVIVLAVIGFICFSILLRKSLFSIYKKGSHDGLYKFFLLIIPIGIAIIVADCFFPLSENINAPFPQSLLFYPCMAYIAETVFHILPLAIILTVAAVIVKGENLDRLIWPALVIVAAVEPTYQIVFGLNIENITFTEIYVFPHVLMISLVQLWIFKRYDFVSMYLFRLAYYLVWHIIWGYLRLQILF